MTQDKTPANEFASLDGDEINAITPLLNEGGGTGPAMCHYALTKAARETDRDKMSADVYAALKVLGAEFNNTDEKSARLVFPVNKIELAMRLGDLLKDGQKLSVAIAEQGKVIINVSGPEHPPVRLTADAKAYNQKFIDNPTLSRKVRNSCISGHYLGDKCHLCAHAELNQYTTGDFRQEPTVDQLIEFDELNHFHMLKLANIPVLQYLRQVANLEVTVIGLSEATVTLYRDFLRMYYGFEHTPN